MHSNLSLGSIVAPALLATALGPAASIVAAMPQEVREVEIETSASSVERYQSQSNDGPSVSLRVENGEVAEVRVGDETVPTDRARREGGAWIVTGADGVEIARFVGGASADPRAVVRRFRGGYGAAQAFIERRAAGQRGRMAEGLTGLAEPQPRVMMGIGLGPVDGALAHHLGIDPAKVTTVTYLVDGAPAQKAGLEKFDVIVSVNGEGDASPDAIRLLTARAEAGAKVAIEVLRRGERKSFEVELAPFATDAMAPTRAMGQPVLEWLADGPDGFGAEIEAMLEMGDDGEGGDGTIFFIGPDGERQELRMPGMRGMPQMPALPLFGMNGVEAEAFERQMDEFARRMEAWGERFERRMEERMRGGRMPMPRGERGMRDAEAREQEEQLEAEAAPQRPRMQPGQPRWESDPRRDAPAMNDDRIRRLEEQMERLMRELEKANAGNGSAPNDA